MSARLRLVLENKMVFLLRYVAPILVGAILLYGFAFTHSLLKELG